MKFKTLSAAAIVAALTVGTLSPVTASALESTGTVTITEGELPKVPGGTTDPEKPDEKLPVPDPDGPGETTNTAPGALGITKVTQLRFGSLATQSTTIKKSAEPVKFDNGAKTRGAYVEFGDIRSGDKYGYTITAKMSQQFTSGTNKLNNATITYNNGILVAEGGNTNKIPTTFNSGNLELTEAGNAVEVVTASNATADKLAGEGKGLYVMEFGQSPDYAGTGGTAGTANKAVELTIPAATASSMAIGDYNAIVTWTIAAAN